MAEAYTVPSVIWLYAYLSDLFRFQFYIKITAFTALTLLVWHQEEHLACKRWSDKVLV